MLNPKLKQAAESLKSTYNSAYEYTHTVFDNFVDPTIIKDVEVEARLLTQMPEHSWRFGGGDDEHASQLLKRGIKELDKMLPSMNLLCRYFNNPEFL